MNRNTLSPLRALTLLKGDEMKHKKLSNAVPVWSEVPTYEDWIHILGMDDSDESYGAWLEAFGDETDAD